MPTTRTDEPYTRTIEFTATARWHWYDVPPSADPAATAFVPAAAGSLAFEPDVGGGAVLASTRPALKPVLYIPVKKERGTEAFPSLRIYLSLIEVGDVHNVAVPAHAGAKVEIRVWNVWGEHAGGPAKLHGTLDANNECAIVVPPERVEAWLDPNGELRGRVNEVLLDFDFTIPSLKINGRPMVGESATRVYLYRRKVIVFLPGVFGSQIQVQTPDGRTLGFPDYYLEPTPADELMDAMFPGNALGRQIGALSNQKVGGLECDAAGRPLIEAVEPTLFSLRGQVYDVFDNCRDARMRYFAGVPEAFRLVEIQLFTYDWRTDLTESAHALAATLEALQTKLRALPDVDDEVGLVGHSTGGVIIRRALGEAGMPSKVSHAFFISVPFLGAPKALSVILTGQDPPGGDRMIPFVTPDSLRDTALSMPVVYHLAPCEAYADRVALTPARPHGVPRSIEDDKRDLIETAISAGLRPRPRFVRASGLSAAERALLAANADAWHELWAQASERQRAQALYDVMYPDGHSGREAWLDEQLRSRGLDAQHEGRVHGGWNLELAARAAQFHRESRAVGASGAWADKAYIFFSKDDAPTTLTLHLERTREATVTSPLELLDPGALSMSRLVAGDVTPPRVMDAQRLKEGRQAPALLVHEWTGSGEHIRRAVWRLWAENDIEVGDGTVPLSSLLGFGGKARFASVGPERGNTAHIHTPKDPGLWSAILRALQRGWVSPPIDERDAATAAPKVDDV